MKQSCRHLQPCHEDDHQTKVTLHWTSVSKQAKLKQRTNTLKAGVQRELNTERKRQAFGFHGRDGRAP